MFTCMKIRGNEKNFEIKSQIQSKSKFKLKDHDKVNRSDTKNANTIIKQSYGKRQEKSRRNYPDSISFAMSVLLIASKQIRGLVQNKG